MGEKVHPVNQNQIEAEFQIFSLSRAGEYPQERYESHEWGGEIDRYLCCVIAFGLT